MSEQHRCPECGADWTGGSTCQSVFDEFMGLEFYDTGYWAVHMLTVACFMIQHGRYSDAGLAWIEKQLRVNLDGEMTQEQIRASAAGEVSQSQRDWKVTRRPDEPPLPKIPWSMTIVDVERELMNYQGTDDAARYQELIKQWARITLKEMRPLLDRS